MSDELRELMIDSIKLATNASVAGYKSRDPEVAMLRELTISQEKRLRKLLSALMELEEIAEDHYDGADDAGPNARTFGVMLNIIRQGLCS
jgi:hypothetical protein